MNIAVCEDNAADAGEIRDLLRSYLKRNGFIGEIRVFESGEALLDAFSPGVFDAVFLDIYMDGISGMETAKKMRAADGDFALVFITVSERHAMEAFARRACAYVPKPINREAIEAAFEQCRSVFIKNARFIEIITDRQRVKIPLIKIYYIEVYDKQTLFHTTAGVLKTRSPLDDVEPNLDGMFLRCHRSYLVNLNHVDCVGESDILMKNGELVPMRQRGRREVRTAYGKFLTDRLFETR